METSQLDFLRCIKRPCRLAHLRSGGVCFAPPRAKGPASAVAGASLPCDGCSLLLANRIEMLEYPASGVTRVSGPRIEVDVTYSYSRTAFSRQFNVSAVLSLLPSSADTRIREVA